MNSDELRVPRETINLEKGESAGKPKITRTNWVPSAHQQELRQKNEERAAAFEEQVRQEFESRPEIRLIRTLEGRVALLEDIINNKNNN